VREMLRSIYRRRPLPYTRNGLSHLSGTDIPHHVLDSARPAVASDLPDADVVIATWWETAEWVATFPRSKGAKAYFLQHFETHVGMPVDRVEATWRSPMHKIVIADWLADLARHRFGDRDVSLVPNAVDTRQFFAPPRDKQPVPTVGVMYSLVPFKGCDISLKAYDLVRQRLPNLQLVTFGNRRPESALPLPAGAQYVYQPPQETIRDLYAACDAWLFASRSEGFGLPILEAMACRTPVIGTPAGAAPELIGQGGGALVHMEDPAGMADAIERVVTLPNDQWRAMSDRAYETATKYSWDDATDRFEAALKRAVEKQRR
jgi:glycosyltransferase involved in cell wall biosynthesis